MESWVSSRESMQKFVAGCGEHVHYSETCLTNMFGMPAVEAFLRICLLRIQMTLHKGAVKDLGEVSVCVAVCCSVLQRVAACCSVLQRVAIWFGVFCI